MTNIIHSRSATLSSINPPTQSLHTMWNPDGSGRHPPVDLSTRSSSSSSALLSSIRAQREAREHQRRLEAAATTVQRVWRGRRVAAQVHSDILDSLEASAVGVDEGARALLILLRGRGERARVARVLDKWTASALIQGKPQPLHYTAPAHTKYRPRCVTSIPQVRRRRRFKFRRPPRPHTTLRQRRASVCCSPRFG